MVVATRNVVLEPVGMKDTLEGQIQGLQGRSESDYAFRFSLLRLTSWPNLPQLEDDIIPLAARICALLACKPTAASLIPLILGAPEARVYAVIEMLRQGQHIQVTGGNTANNAQATPDVQAATIEMQASKTQVSSIIGNLWQRLGIRS